MTSSRLRRTTTGGVIAATLLTATAALAATSSTSTPVDVTTLPQDRTFTLKTLNGTALDATHGLHLVNGQPAPFLMNVTDLNYQRQAYQVKVAMSDLYPYSGSSYSWTNPIPSQDVSLGYVTNPLDIGAVKSLVQPVVTLAGNLTGTVTGPALGLLGLGSPDLSTYSIAGTNVTGVAQNVDTLTQDVANGLLASLPIQVQTGTGGTFDSPAQLSATGAPSVSGTPTQLTALSGQPNDASAAVLSLLQTATGTQPVSTLISQGLVTQDQVLQQISAATGLSLTVLQSFDPTALLASVTGQVTGLIGGLLGQSGSYTALPTLTVTVPSTAHSGGYRGEMTVTFADPPTVP
jgi:hypothetical protein